MIDKIVAFINDIGERHCSFSDQFFSRYPSYNLKKTRVDTILKDSSYDQKFMDLIDNYIDELTFWFSFLDFEFESSILETRFRGKNKESALNKLFHYRFERSQSSIPIQKCLNDLLGFRIIIDAEFDYQALLADIETSEDLSVTLFRSYARIDENYQAIHLYVKSDNNSYFPWEIQIWRKSDEVSNEQSHRDHEEKRRYTNWTKVYENNNRKES